MNFKSLLLGSAAALVAVSGARAADVIVPVAPEPVDYVRVCDVYGAGFYYIPGTETCLSIGGYVRFRFTAIDNVPNSEGDDYTAGTAVRVRLNLDAREETELGTLRGFARLQATEAGGNRAPGYTGGNDQGYSMDMGYIQLGGLTMGYLDSLWTEGDGLFTDTDLPVGDFQTNRASYTFAANGFSAAVSIEDDDTGDFAPDVVARLAYDAGFFSAYIAGSYDERLDLNRASASFNDTVVIGGSTYFVNSNGALSLTDDNSFNAGLNPNQDDDGAFALKGAVTITPFEDAQFKVEGSYAFDPTIYSTIGILDTNLLSVGNDQNFGSTQFVEWQVGAGYQQAFGKASLGLAGVYGETFDTFADVNNNAIFDPINFGSGEYYKLVGNVGYEVTNNFSVLGEISYANIDYDNGSVDQTAGFIQFLRSF